MGSDEGGASLHRRKEGQRAPEEEQEQEQQEERTGEAAAPICNGREPTSTGSGGLSLYVVFTACMACVALGVRLGRQAGVDEAVSLGLMGGDLSDMQVTAMHQRERLEMQHRRDLLRQPPPLGVVPPKQHYEYVIVGAGPGGLQMAAELEERGRDYIVLERNAGAGSFFRTFPRHRRLISANKRYTGDHNYEFNLRHDWNSLLSNDSTLLMREFSKDYFPHADALADYFQHFADRLKLNVQYGWEVRRIERAAQGDDSQIFTLRLGLTGSHSDEDSEGASGTTLTCTRLLYATGATTPNVPRGSIEGLEKYSIGYEDAPIDPEYYAGKRVAILGNGNSAFETANNIFSRAAYVHIAGRSRVRLSWSTHYVGDVRAVNSHLLDNYQLKSIDLHFETGGRQMRLQPGMNGSIGLANAKRQKSLGSGGGGELSDEERQQMQKYEAEGYATLAGAYRHELEHSRNEYDVVIRCLGFVFDSSPFARSARPLRGIKYPNMTAEYESINVPGLFFVGSLQHAVDYRRSSGGFIHGFRYLIRALARTLDQRFHDTPWPRNAVAYENKAIGERIVQRMNEASAPYQMFGVLGDVVLLPVLDKSAAEASLLDSLPDCEYLQDVLMYANNTLLPADRPYITFSFEYGTNFSYPGADTFHAKRVTTKVSKAELSNFLHPVLRLYRRRGEPAAMARHILEDSHTWFTHPKRHIRPALAAVQEFLDQYDLWRIQYRRAHQ